MDKGLKRKLELEDGKLDTTNLAKKQKTLQENRAKPNPNPDKVSKNNTMVSVVN